MYGVLKVHKPNAPLQPILSMVNSPQHATAKWLSTLLKPVSKRFSAFTIKDSFTFADAVKKVSMPKGAHMSSFDIKSLFTNVPLDETVDIIILCAETLPFRPWKTTTIREIFQEVDLYTAILLTPFCMCGLPFNLEFYEWKLGDRGWALSWHRTHTLLALWPDVTSCFTYEKNRTRRSLFFREL